jgi:hypothetical protein
MAQTIYTHKVSLSPEMGKRGKGKRKWLKGKGKRGKVEKIDA